MSQKKREPLSRDQIINRAVQILDAEGEAGLSMRQLAAEFKVDPMSLYYHIPNKESLIDEAINTVIMALEIPPIQEDWQTQLRLLCHSFRHLAQKHPKIYALYSSYHKPITGDFFIGEAFLSVLQSANLKPKPTLHALMTVMTYVCGFALEEATGKRPYSNYVDFAAISQMKISQFPTVYKYLEVAKQIDMDEEFEFGLSLIVAGIIKSPDDRSDQNIINPK